jgi:hypothetical protein
MNCEMCKELEAEVARLKAQAQLWTTRAELARLRELEAAVLENRTLENAIGISPRTVAAIAACRAARESAPVVDSPPFTPPELADLAAREAMREAGRRAGLGQAIDAVMDFASLDADDESKLITKTASAMADAIRALAAPAPAPDSKEGM